MDLGLTTSIDVIEGRVNLEGQRVIDVGCGDMTFSRHLASRGAIVLGVDPDPIQASRNRAAVTTIANLDFAEADATELLVADQSLDGVFFSFSLHHVPASSYPQVFAEVRRVLVPEGYLCVIEPTDCPLNSVRRLFHDEDHERAAAQDALQRLALPWFRTHDTFRYHSVIQYESFDDFANQFLSKTFNTTYDEADVRRPEVRAAFERTGAPHYRFESPKTMMLLRGLRMP